MRFKTLVTLVAIILANAGLSAKEYSLKLKLHNLPQTQVVLQQKKGDRSYPLDTVTASAGGNILFKLKETYSPGMYSVTVQGMPVWTFIFDNENVEAELNLGAKPETASIISSDGNRHYYRFVSEQDVLMTKLDAVRSVLDTYSPDGDFYARATAEYSQLQYRHDSLFRSAMIRTAKGRQPTAAMIYIAAAHQLSVPLSVPLQLRNEYIREHYFDQLILADTALLYSDLFSKKLLGYYRYYVENQQSHEAVLKAYITATDTILRRLSPYPEIYRFAANFLMDGFEGIGQESVADFIAEQYSDMFLCESTNNLHGIDIKSLNRTKLRVGADAPVFRLSDGAVTFDYRAEPERTVVLVFWATWCDHCTQTMPILLRSLGEFVARGAEIVTVSLDTDLDSWRSFVSESGMSGMHNYCPGQSWESSVAQQYAVYATPSFYILSGGRIASKPLDLVDVPDAMRMLFDRK